MYNPFSLSLEEMMEVSLWLIIKNCSPNTVVLNAMEIKAIPIQTERIIHKLNHQHHLQIQKHANNLELEKDGEITHIAIKE